MELTLIYPTISLIYSPTKTTDILVSEVTDYSFDGATYNIMYTRDAINYSVSFAYVDITTLNDYAVGTATELDAIFTAFLLGTNPAEPPDPITVSSITDPVTLVDPVEVETGDEDLTVADYNVDESLNSILNELKIINVHLSIITNTTVTTNDIK